MRWLPTRTVPIRTVLMMGHKIYFHVEIRIIIPKLSLFPLLIWSNDYSIHSTIHWQLLRSNNNCPLMTTPSPTKLQNMQKGWLDCMKFHGPFAVYKNLWGRDDCWRGDEEEIITYLLNYQPLTIPSLTKLQKYAERLARWYEILWPFRSNKNLWGREDCWRGDEDEIITYLLNYCINPDKCPYSNKCQPPPPPPPPPPKLPFLKMIFIDFYINSCLLHWLMYLFDMESTLNPTALRKAKIACNSGLSECNRVKVNSVKDWPLLKGIRAK